MYNGGDYVLKFIGRFQDYKYTSVGCPERWVRPDVAS